LKLNLKQRLSRSKNKGSNLSKIDVGVAYDLGKRLSLEDVYSIFQENKGHYQDNYYIPHHILSIPKKKEDIVWLADRFTFQEIIRGFIVAELGRKMASYEIDNLLEEMDSLINKETHD
jgi:uncharacterized protein (UPF0248 family)